MSAVRAKAGVPVLADFTGPDLQGSFAPIVVDSTTGIVYSWKTGDVIGAFLPNPSSTTLGGVESIAAVTSKWLDSISTSGVPHASQPASTDLSDYAASTWTPVLTFATPGDLAVTYSQQTGEYLKIGKLVLLSFSIITSAFTFTTATGNLELTGLPFTVASGAGYRGSLRFSGITKVGYTQIAANAGSAATLLSFVASGSAVATTAVTAADTPTAGTVQLIGSIVYMSA